MKKDELFKEIYNDFWGESTKKEIEEGAAKKDLINVDEITKTAADKVSASLDEVMQTIANLTNEVKAEEAKEQIIQEEKKTEEAAKAAEETAKAEEAKATAEVQEQEEPEEDPMEKLQSLVGLEDLKHDVKELISLLKVQKMREESGLKIVPVSKHLVFTGNPGTGKTTVARILASLYKQIGAIPKGQLVEVDRSSLVAGFVGQTATKTQEKIQEAMGGILFIDEAYTLAKETGNDFGQEAIDTILKAMEDHRDELVVIVAGYPDLMEKFINSNPGLKSRFNKYLYFPDYSAEELKKIFESNCKKYDYELSEEAQKIVTESIEKMEAEKDENFANARSIRNFFENIITNQATRLAEMEEVKPEDMKVILPEDIDLEAI